MWDFIPSWQNTFQALLKSPEHFIILGAFLDDKLVGYGIIEPFTGDIPQLAVAGRNRRSGIGSTILNELRKYNEANKTRVVNTDAAHEGTTNFFLKNGLQLMTTQLEMIKFPV